MVRHDARAVVLILDKAMGDTGGVNADYAHLDGIEDVRNQKRVGMLIQSEALLLVLKLVLGQILVCCCGGTTRPHGHTLFQFGRAVFQNRLAGINKFDRRGQGQVCTHGFGHK